MADTEPVRVSWTLSIGFAGAQHRGEFEIDRTEWDEKTPGMREELLNDLYDTEIANYLDGGWEIENADLNDPVDS